MKTWMKMMLLLFLLFQVQGTGRALTEENNKKNRRNWLDRVGKMKLPVELYNKARDIKMLRTFILLLLLFIFPLGIFSNTTGLKIITNPGAQVLELKKKDIRDIYTGVKKMWDSGGKVIIAIMEGSKLHKQFLEEYVNKTPIQFRNYWREKVFTGEGENPKTFKTEQDLIDFVANTRGAIGYISAFPYKVVTIVKISGEKKREEK
ncbi:MAG TPA: hypothetical protein VK469_20795 [Candidatus Kapabacteria bacterium]|nr:hypothetical protein [Candidatus Kapabacteria bacterium]